MYVIIVVLNLAKHLIIWRFFFIFISQSPKLYATLPIIDFRDHIMDDKLIYIPNYDVQNYPFLKLRLFVEKAISIHCY